MPAEILKPVEISVSVLGFEIVAIVLIGDSCATCAAGLRSIDRLLIDADVTGSGICMRS